MMTPEQKGTIFMEALRSVPTAEGMITGSCGDPDCPGVHAVVFSKDNTPVCEFVVTEETLAMLERALARRRGRGEQ